MPLGRASAFLHYTQGDDSRKVLYELKYYGNSRLGIFLGRLMANELRASGFFQGIDCIVPVPLHEKKERQRGYNQSEMLANGISSVTGIPVFNNLIVRTRQTETQTHKGEQHVGRICRTSSDVLRRKHFKASISCLWTM